MEKLVKIKFTAISAASAIITIFILASFVLAHTEDEFAQAEEIIKQKISCDKLSDEQLEALGDYFMEQMHPGELHEKMDEMMGGEGSETLKQVHINIAKSFYCGEHDAMPMEMMDMVMGRGMMAGSNMMGNNYPFRITLNLILTILIIVALVLAIIWLINQIKK